MTPMKRTCLFISAALITGTVIGRFFPTSPFLPLIIAFALFLSYLFFKTKYKFSNCLLFLLLIALGWSYYQFRMGDDTDCKLKSLIENNPLKTSIKIKLIEIPSIAFKDEKTETFRFDAEIIQIKTDNEFLACSGKIRCYYKSDKDIQFIPGDILTSEASIYKVSRPTNPGQIDYSHYYQRHNIAARAYLKKGSTYLAGHELPSLPSRIIFWIKSKSSEALHSAFGDKYSSGSSIVSALVLGRRSAIDETREALYTKTGTIHFFALSGLHVAVFGFFLWWTLALLPIPRNIRIVIVMAGMVFYCVIGGASVSLVRATVMGVLYLGAELLWRQRDSLNIIGASAIVIVIISPADVLGIGFQLSFAAVTTIVLLAPFFASLKSSPKYLLLALQRPEERSFIEHARIVFNESIVAWAFVSLSAWIGTAPLVAYHFNIVAPFSILLSIVLAPAIWALLILGLIALLSAFVFAPIARSISPVISLIVDGIEGILNLFSGYPFHFYIPNGFLGHFSIFFLLGWYFILVAVVLHQRYLWPRWLYIKAAGIVILSVFIVLPCIGKSTSYHSITALDVGRGSAFVIRTSDGATVLFDCGGGQDKIGIDVIAPYLWEQGITEIDSIMISHPDADHYIAIEDIIERFRIGSIIVSKYFEMNSDGKDVSKIIRKQGVPLRIVSAGEVIKIGNAYFNVLAPQTDRAFDVSLGDNDTSLILRVKDNGASYLLSGDEEAMEAAILLDSDSNLLSDIIIVPHHGGKNPFIRELTERTNAEYAIISGGYNQAQALTIELLNNAGVKVLLTERYGAITLQYVDNRYVVKTYLPY